MYIFTPNTLIESAKINANFDELVTDTTKHYIQTIMSANQSITSSGSTIAFDTTDILSGTKLTRSGNTILIGAGVSIVKVSYSLMTDAGASATYLFSRIRKNSTDMSQQIDAVANQFRATSDTRLVSVVQNDTISLFADSGSVNTITIPTGRKSCLSVEVMG